MSFISFFISYCTNKCYNGLRDDERRRHYFCTASSKAYSLRFETGLGFRSLYVYYRMDSSLQVPASNQLNCFLYITYLNTAILNTLFDIIEVCPC